MQEISRYIERTQTQAVAVEQTIVVSHAALSWLIKGG